MAGRRLISSVDKPFIAAIAGLCLLGLYNLSSAGQPLGLDLHYSQGTYMGLGLLAMIVVASIDYRNFEGLAIPAYLTVLALLFATDVAGKVVNGSRRWLPLGPVNLQTSDLAKLGVILILARTLHTHRRETSGGLTLREIFRPFNLSRPLILLVVVLALSLAGDALKPTEVKRRTGTRSRLVAKLTAKRSQLIIGRALEADIQIRASDVADRHAELVRRGDGEYVLRDLETESGTYVNGERIQGERRLKDGDSFRVGLNARSELHLSATTMKLKPLLPWLAIVGTIWLFVAMFLQFSRGLPTARDLIAPVDLVAIPCVLVLAQPDLGTALILGIVAFTMFLYVGMEPLSLLLLGVLSGASGVFAWRHVLKPYQKERVMSFLDPELDLAGAGYHQHQSIIAIGSGELAGKGYGQGTQTQLSFLPEQQTDFIFSVWSEEHGFLGCILVVILFAIAILLAFRIATLAKDRFGQLLAVGVTAMLFWHATINMLMVLRLAPVVGVPLPLWSNGGSFVVTVLMGVGIVINVGMRRYVF